MKNELLPSAVDERFRRLVLIFHQFDIGWHKVQAREVCFADHFREWSPFPIVSDRSVEGFVLRYIELGLIAVQRGKARLRVEIDCECPIAAKRKKLSKMRGGGRLPAAPFEVHDSDDLKMVTISPPWQVSSIGFAALVEIRT